MARVIHFACSKPAAPALPPIDRVTIELTRDEAHALAQVFGNVGGSPTKSLRGEIDNIAKALHGLGFISFGNTQMSGSGPNDTNEHAVISGAVHFIDSK